VMVLGEGAEKKGKLATLGNFNWTCDNIME
jgi:hypothetical protein